MQFWGAAIPGITMKASDLPPIPGLLRLDNPERGEGHVFGRFYSMEEAAERHAERLESLKDQLETPFTLMGMSMGGMLVSILATRFRHKLPARCQFRFIVTSPNAGDLPALPFLTMLKWSKMLRRTPQSFREVVTPFFGAPFREKNKDFLEKYYETLAHTRDQELWPLIRQIHALRTFRGMKYFSQINPEEAVFIGGDADEVLGPRHTKKLKELLPKAVHHELKGIGHMIHLEARHVFERELKIR